MHKEIVVRIVFYVWRLARCIVNFFLKKYRMSKTVTKLKWFYNKAGFISKYGFSYIVT